MPTRSFRRGAGAAIRSWIGLGLALVFPLCLSIAPATAQTTKPGVRIYLVDVEGGAATLMVTPAGQSILVDTGWPGERDADRIVHAMQATGVHRIDYLIITHFHIDHIGGLKALAAKVPIGQVLDHGLLPGPVPSDIDARLYADYVSLTKGKRRTARPGESLPLKQLAGTPHVSLHIVSEDRKVRSLADAPSNPLCKDLTQQPYDSSDNGNSVAMVLQYGKFRYFDGGDTTWDVEGTLVCPKDEIGRVSLYQVDHHGMDISNNPVLIKTLAPKAAIENNGAHKAGMPAAYHHVREVLPARDIFQIHRNMATSAADNTIPVNIANPGAQDLGKGFHVIVSRDGKSFKIVNERTGEVRTYQS